MQVAKSFLLILVCFSNTLFAQSSKNIAAIQQSVEHILGHDAHGHYHFHTHPMVCDVNIDNNNLNLYIETSETEVDGELYDHFLESLLPLVEEENLNELKVFIRAKHWTTYRDLTKVTPSIPIPEYRTPSNTDPFPAISNTDQRSATPTIAHNATGALTGKTVWLSPGHGWTYSNVLGRWATQRGNTNDYVEDFGTVGGIDYYLQQYLINAGANVWVVRERDVNTNEVVVDNDAGAPSFTTNGAWTVSGSTGYDGGTYQFANSSASETHEAIYTPSIPESGWYWISVYFRQGANRPSDTRYKVNHAGGQTIISVNQEVHGLTWNYIGQFYFEAGTQGSVVLSNASNEVGQAVIADAVRFGGGMGDSVDCTYTTMGISGEPRFEECARQYALFQGYPTCTGDVTVRPKYAEWELAKGAPTEQANALYLAWHTNASMSGDARGTVTYSYNGAGTPPITAGSADLSNFVQTELMNDIWGEWDSSWQDRGTKTANFGELRELTTMPGALVEVAFHDNVTDANALKTPAFRNLAARAMYQGIVKFFNDRDGSPIDVLPEPPSHILAQNTGTGEITVQWQAPAAGNGVGGDAATGYQVYLSTHGKGFQDGVAVTGTSHTFTGLQAGTTYYFRVAATNAGGESFPTSTVAARTPTSGFAPQYLLVDGFDRLDRSALINQYESAALGSVDRMFLERMNSFDYMVEHAKGFEYCGISFDGTTNDAVLAGTVVLDNYAGVDWILGEESTIDETLNTTEQALLATYLDNGGNLIISGAEIGWDLGRTHSGNSSTSFYNNYLKAAYAGDDGATYDFVGTTGGVLDGISGSFDDGTNGYYDSEFPDRLAPSGGSTVVLNYSGGTGDGAAIAYKGTDFGVFNFGFPLESVTDVTVRGNLICDAITCLTPNVCPFDEDINTTYNSGDISTIVVENSINATATVANGATVVFNAGTQLCLESGFEVELGAEFLGTIGGCVNLQEEAEEQ